MACVTCLLSSHFKLFILVIHAYLELVAKMLVTVLLIEYIQFPY